METDLSSIENKWRSFWDRNDTYAFTDNGKDKIFSIDTPPPTVSGELHMGHSFSYVHQDIIARYRRMRRHHQQHKKLNCLILPFNQDSILKISGILVSSNPPDFSLHQSPMPMLSPFLLGMTWR